MIRRLASVFLFLALGTLSAACAQSLRVESWPPPRGEAVSLAARYWPAPDATAAAPAPAVLLMHGCGGWYGDNIDRWASWFGARGYHALAVDSFGSRGHPGGICASLGTGRVKVGWLNRVSDAYGALAWLAERPEVDPASVLAVGFSNGGTTVLLAMLQGYAPRGVPPARRFRAAIAFYPWCRGAIESSRAELTGPTLILAGTADDWTPAAPCRAAAQRYDGPHRLDAHLIEGAYHSFDMFRWRGRPVGSRTYLGHRLEPSRSAVAEAESAIQRFLSAERLPAGG